ncbi:NAD(P)H-dependent oxidoreductase [Acidihalobacter ferrooxydans]|uniref:Flavodoxin n=1 Tax=Acidihalobacter ferrooxydans TaxID=1765967 RepID=A0A1P8UES1_9GAMM|nr:NAD(P)H-dependent oxidoreductase [Acidihalobacter ferrooxydans]APZ42352.1 flavodoxin [Acidihalobacter ferrooxydans]
MSNILIINAHEYYPFSEGRLNQTLADTAAQILSAKGHALKTTTMRDDYDIAAELEKHRWANVIILQMPVNWMGVPWSFKKYMDVVYTAGMDGTLCKGDGRSHDGPTKQYGAGGTLTETKYMLSLTFNAPKDAFGDTGQYLFQGKSVDDLLFPMHMNFRFFGMQPLETFACHDVMKKPDIDNDLTRFEAHLNKHLSGVDRDEQKVQRAL